MGISCLLPLTLLLRELHAIMEYFHANRISNHRTKLKNPCFSPFSAQGTGYAQSVSEVMNVRSSSARNHGLTIFEILLIIVCILLLAALLPPVLVATKRRDSRLSCVSNIKMVNLAFRIWEGDNNNLYPMSVSVTRGGGLELVETGNVASCFQAASNELSTPKILVCPNDWKRRAATNFENDFNNSHISYFLNPDANETYPQMIMDGDDNFIVGGIPVKPGLLQVPTTTSIIWGPGRHGDVPTHHFWLPRPKHFLGNIGFADGSVAEESDLGLESAIVYSTYGTSFPTNRWAIP